MDDAHLNQDIDSETLDVFMLLWCIDVLFTSRVRSDYVVTKSGYV